MGARVGDGEEEGGDADAKDGEGEPEGEEGGNGGEERGEKEETEEGYGFVVAIGDAEDDEYDISARSKSEKRVEKECLGVVVSDDDGGEGRRGAITSG